MEILLLFIGLAVGGVIAYLITNKQRGEIEKQLLLKGQQLEQEQAIKQDLQAQLNEKLHDNKALNDQITALKVELGRINTQLEEEQKRNSQEATLRKEQFEEQLKTVQEQFSNLATRVLNQTSEQLKSTNNESFESITKPLKHNIEQLQTAIQATNNETAKHTATLSEQLNSMREQTNKIDATATRLTNVMRGGNKIQGNWGEMILTEILDAQGFVRGINYDVQQTLTDDKGNVMKNDDSGSAMKPDVILHYPNNEDVVIDSKMSIQAYSDYVEAENDVLKRKFADDLVRSLRTQMTQLAKKDYSSYIKSPRHAIDFVIMFVPNDGALQLAFATDPKLWNDAFNQHVFITGQQNLMAILKVIEIAWRQHAQSVNQKKVFDMADEMLKRVDDFIKRFEKVGNDIDSLHKHYDFARDKVYNGRQSVEKTAIKLRELGVKESANSPITEAEQDVLEEL